MASSDRFPPIQGYQIEQQIYAGSKTIVYRGTRIADDQPVILKKLRSDRPTIQDLLRIRNHYAIAKNLNSKGIVKPISLENYGYGYVIVMLDEGYSALSDYVADNPLNLIEVLAIAIQLATILDELYCQHVIHKDIKPSNILINPKTKQVKLTDFDLATLLTHETQTLISSNILEGTLAYMSPEQTGRMNRGIDYRSDFYTFGVVLFELLTGLLPFPSDDPLEIVHCHLAKPVPSVSEFKPEIPNAISKIVAKLMAKNAEERYQSALGLKYDLEICLNQLNQTGTITSFRIGTRDISDRFIIPKKLYGRDVEVKTLLEAFDRVSNGSNEMILVAGFSGIGKTAVVNEIHKPIVRQRGYFIKGKYDQFQRNIPFSGFVQAFRDLMEQILSESDTKLQRWKDRILEAVNANGQVLIEVIPEVEHIIGCQPPAAELSENAAQNRFNLLMQKFVQVFTIAEHPLAIFLDDLQWADLASLKLLQLLMQDSGHLLVVGAYRDNEVSPVHPLMLTINEIVKSRAKVNTIHLLPLSEVDLNHLVADTLICDLLQGQILTELVYQKTEGNPFFATQFLKSLHEDGWITFNWDERYWQWDFSQIAFTFSDDVVEFMGSQLQKLPVETQDVLKVAACIGAQFDLQTLAIASQLSPEDTARALWQALLDGLIIPTNESYKLFILSNEVNTITQPEANATYKFLHDRIQQAAYSLILEDQKQKTHLKIGRLLLEKLPQKNQDTKLLDIVSHLNRGTLLITQPNERDNMARLNWRAAKKAKSNIAYRDAAQYLQIGMDFLSADSWLSQYELTLALHELSAEIAFLCGDFEKAENWLKTILGNTKDLLDRVKLFQIQIQVYQAQSRLLEAVSIGLEVLRSLGISFPETVSSAEIQSEMAIISDKLADRSTASLLNLQMMTDKYLLAAMRIYSSMSSSAYLSNPNVFALLVAKAVNLSIQSGNTPDSTLAYADYAVLLCGVGEIELGCQFGQLSLELLNQLNAKKFKANVFLPVNASIRHWQEPLRNTLSPLLEAYKAGLESGDLEFAALSSHIYCYHLYLVGEDLPAVKRQMSLYVEEVNRLQQQTFISSHKVYQQTVLNLVNESAYQCQLKGDSYDEDLMLPVLLKANRRTEIYSLYFNKLILSYLFGEYTAAVENAEIAVQYIDGVRSRAVVPCFYFYESLSKLAVYSISSSVERPEIIQQVDINQKKMAEWARLSPANYRHKFCLVAAEQFRVLGNKADAIDYYDRAISGARDNLFLNEESIANELAAKFYLDWGKEKVAAAYMQEAYYCYERWGAIAKVVDLERRYPQLLSPLLQKTRTSISIPKTVNHSSSSNSESLDLETLLKASQAISEEIEIGNLLITLLNIAITNACADKCVLLLQAENELQVVALVESGQPSQVFASPTPLALSEDVAIGLVNQVRLSLEPLVLSDARQDAQFASDRHILKYRPKSVLCIPILKQGKLIGVLYLENSLTIGAFTGDRLKILNLICSQASISLENAQLYQTLHESEAKFRRLVEGANDMIWAAKADSTLTYLSPQFQTMFGLPPSEWVGESFTKLIHPDDLEQTVALARFSLQRLENLQNIEFRHLCRDGSYLWVTANITPIIDNEGKAIGQQGIIRDISDRKHAETVLQRQLTAVEASLDGIAIIQNDNFIYMNEAHAQIFGYDSSAELLSKTWRDLYPSEEISMFEQDVFPFLRQHKQWRGEAISKRKDGTTFDEEISLVITGNGDLICVCRDISDRKRSEAERSKAEQALRESENRYHSLAKVAPVGIFRTDLNGDCIYANEQWRHLAGLASVAVLGKGWVSAIHPDDRERVFTEWHEAVLSEHRFQSECRFEHIITGQTNWVLAQAIAEREPNGDIIGYVGTITDISDRKRSEAKLQLQAQQLEEYSQTLEQKVKERTQELSQALTNLQTTQAELIHSEKMALLGQLTASIAHEINTPLGVIRAATSNIVSDLKKSLQQLPYILQSLSPQQREAFLDLVNTSLQNEQILSTREERKLRRYFEMTLEANGISNFHNIAMQLTLLRTGQDLSPYQSILQSPNCDEILQVAHSMVSQHQSTKNIQQEVDRAAKIVFALKTYSHQSQSEEKSLVQISEGIEIALTLYQNRLKQGIEVIRNYEIVPDLLCDPDVLTQVWVNLIDNALYAIGQRGTLEISIAQQLKFVVVEITDSGDGIPIEIQSKIFEPFMTSKPRGEGSGLGLDIVLQIVRKHGGDIQFRSQIGRTTFSVIIPLEII